ncbi:MAG TPA: hypothetical protein VGK10_01940 [Prolixibacteraceae bacterium]|jgi:hypothetical protein
MATNPTPDIEVLKNPHKKKFNQLPVGIVFPSDIKATDEESENVEEETDEWFESPNNFFYERKYIDF